MANQRSVPLAASSIDGSTVEIPEPENVLLLSLDCVRSEALSCYPETFSRYHRFPYSAKTPNIDRIAADGVQFTQCFCQAPYTPASHASVFTGLNPYRHGIREIFGYQLYDDVTTTAELLGEDGISTGGFIGAHAMNSKFGLSRGFQEYDETFEQGQENWVLGERRSSEDVTNSALDWLRSTDEGWFLFMHYFDAHDGGRLHMRALDALRRLRWRVDEIDPRPGYAVNKLVDSLGIDPNYGRRYHVRQTNRIDKQVGRILSTLKFAGVYDETLVVIFADHGDAFGEHGEYNHRKHLYDTTLHVPLLVKFPESSVTGTCSELVRLVDIHPTVADLLGLEADDVDGRSLRECLKNGWEETAYAETRLEHSTRNPDELETSYVGLRTPRWKFILDQLDGNRELYDLKIDPDELDNVVSDHPDMAADFEDEIERLHEDTPESTDNEMSNEDLSSVANRLQQLGYLDS